MTTGPEDKKHPVLQSPTLPLPPPGDPGEAATANLLNRLSPDEIAQLGEALKSNPNLLGRKVQAAAEVASKAEFPSHLAPVTREDIARNNRCLKAMPPHLQSIENFLPELKKKKPEQVLHILGERYSRSPTAANATLLQHAVNRITTTGAVEPHIKRAITAATEVLHRKSAADGTKTDDIFYTAYVDANFGGASMFGDLPPGWIYLATSYVGDAMNDKISSLIATCMADEVGGNVILFENAGFVGNYQNYALTVPPGVNEYVSEEVSYVGDAFNDITSSILIVRRFANELAPVSIGSLVPQRQISAIVNGQSQVSSAGNATFTWDMWPTGGSHPNDPNKIFIWVIVPINVDTQTIFGTYSCQVRYWIYLYVDGQGNLQGYVDYYGCWVQGGWITGDVQNGLMQKIPGTIGQVNNLVSQALALANIGGPYQFTYFLPGNNNFTGSTWDDVTVVAVKA